LLVVDDVEPISLRRSLSDASDIERFASSSTRGAQARALLRATHPHPNRSRCAFRYGMTDPSQFETSLRGSWTPHGPQLRTKPCTRTRTCSAPFALWYCPLTASDRQIDL